jgi:hypothetical protein
MNRIAGLAAAALVSGALGLAGLGMTAGTAEATPGGTNTWCPGDQMPQGSLGAPLAWDMSVCHDWYEWNERGPDGRMGYSVHEGDYPVQLGPML